MKALIAVELFERGGPTCLNDTGGFCKLVNICCEREHYRPLPSCPLRCSPSDSAIREAERLTIKARELAYLVPSSDDIECHNRVQKVLNEINAALAALKKARE